MSTSSRNGDDEEMISVRVFHGGRLNILHKDYVGGRLTVYDFWDISKITLENLQKNINALGYKGLKSLYYRIAWKRLEGGLVLINSEEEVKNMKAYAYYNKNRVDVFVKHDSKDIFIADNPYENTMAADGSGANPTMEISVDRDESGGRRDANIELPDQVEDVIHDAEISVTEERAEIPIPDANEALPDEELTRNDVAAQKIKKYRLETELIKNGAVVNCQAKGAEDARLVIEAVKSKGISAVGAAGFCWGEVKVPIAVLGAEFDKISPPELVKQSEEVLSTKPECLSEFKNTKDTTIVIDDKESRFDEGKKTKEKLKIRRPASTKKTHQNCAPPNYTGPNLIGSEQPATLEQFKVKLGGVVIKTKGFMKNGKPVITKEGLQTALAQTRKHKEAQGSR